MGGNFLGKFGEKLCDVWVSGGLEFRTHRPWVQFCVSYGKMLLPLGRHREALILLYIFMVSH